MKRFELERTHTIAYNWHREDGKDIDESVFEYLDQHALDRIDELAFKQNYVEGELVTEIDDVEYRGWWKFQFN